MWNLKANENETIPSYVTHVDSFIINRKQFIIIFPQRVGIVVRDWKSNLGLHGKSHECYPLSHAPTIRKSTYRIFWAMCLAGYARVPYISSI